MKISLSKFLMQHTIMLHVFQVIDLMPLIGHHFRLQMDRTPDISKSVGVIYFLYLCQAKGFQDNDLATITHQFQFLLYYYICNYVVI